MLRVAVRWNWRPMASLPLTAFTSQHFHTLNPRPPCRTVRLFCRPSSSAVAHTSLPLSADLHRYLRCSLPQNSPLRVAVLVSGGVDSSVALRLLHAAGHSCTAFYLKIWFQVRLHSSRLKLNCVIDILAVAFSCVVFCRKILRTFGLSAPGKRI